ncbi:YMGG-like glycine zipper-containing protein [Ferrovibrio sp.]|uniref:YMGG-like glycine zipper-containing protein n=1 Tax=Ferrovibrio sp. TaxID=1917215 RepID=UPI003D0C3D85
MIASSRVTKISALALLALVATGCENMNSQQQRTLSGGAIGAAAGTAIGLMTGHTLAGALIGGAGGAAVGAMSK